LADKVGVFNCFATSAFLTGVATLALWIPGKTQAATIAFAALFGFFSGAYFTLIGALVAKVSPPPEIGFRTGLAFLFCSIPALVTNPIAGAILQHSGQWEDLKAFAGALCLAGAFVIMVCRLKYTNYRLATVF